MTAADGQRRLRILLRHDGHARHRVSSTAAASNSPKLASVASALRTSPSASLRQLRERCFIARLEVDQRDVVARIGEHDRDAAAHAARAETGDGRLVHRKPSASTACSALRSRPPSPSDCSVRPVCMKSSPQIAPPIGRNARASGVGTPASSPHGNEKRQADPHVLQHVAMLRQHDVLAPVARVGELVVRAAAVHPLLAVLGVVVGEREVRRAIAERLAHRDALRVERVGDAAHGGLRALLVDVPALEMLERRGVHGDQRRMDDRPGIHQRAGERIAAVLDHAGKRAADDGERMVLLRQRKARRSAGAWRGW